MRKAPPSEPSVKPADESALPVILSGTVGVSVPAIRALLRGQPVRLGKIRWWVDLSDSKDT